jgi:peptidoglycan/LPS O-acetylase OafA/YrhL
MNLVNSREKLLLIAGSAALRGRSLRRGFSPDVLLLGRGFDRRPSGFEQFFAADVQFPNAAPYTWFGWVGVEIFFVISGFVIANSASKSSPKEFLFGRALRLYPAVWIASTLSLVILLIFLREKASEFILPYFQAMLLIPKGINGQVA